MKRFVKLLSLGLLLTMASCSTSEGESSPSSSDSVVSSSMPEQETNGTILKRIADDMFDYFGASRDSLVHSSIKKAIEPVPDNYRGPELQLPPIYLYLSGLLSDIDGVDLDNKAFQFVGNFEGLYGENEYQDMVLDLTLHVHFDKDNNKVFFEGLQNMTLGSMTVNGAYVFVDISYNFATKTVGDFKLYMNQFSNFYYFEVLDGALYRIGDGTSAEEIAAQQTYTNYVSAFNALCGSETKVTASGALLRSAEEAYVATQNYADALFGSSSGIRIKETA